MFRRPESPPSAPVYERAKKELPRQGQRPVKNLLEGDPKEPCPMRQEVPEPDQGSFLPPSLPVDPGSTAGNVHVLDELKRLLRAGPDRHFIFLFVDNSPGSIIRNLMNGEPAK